MLEVEVLFGIIIHVFLDEREGEGGCICSRACGLENRRDGELILLLDCTLEKGLDLIHLGGNDLL